MLWIQVYLTVFLLLFSPSNSISSPFVDTNPIELQTGSFRLKIGNFQVLTTDFAPSGGVWIYTYTITLTRMKNQDPTDYQVCLGFYGLSVLFGQGAASTLQFSVTKSSQQTSQFSVLVQTSDGTMINKMKPSYLAFSKTLNFYMNEHTQTPMLSNPSLVLSKNFPDIPNNGITYLKILSITGMKFAYAPAAISGNFDMAVSVIDRNNYYLHLTGFNMYIDHVAAQILFFTSQLLQSPFTFAAGTGYTRNTLYNNPPLIYADSDNSFGTLYHFGCSMGSLDYEFVTDSGIFYLDMFGFTDQIYGAYILLQLTKCAFPFSYYPPISACITCPRNCLSCTPAQCVRCAKSFNLSGDKKSCICLPPLQAISNICYDFASHPQLNGCKTAIMNKVTQQVECKFCSVNDHLIAKNNKCQCKDGWAMNAWICEEVCQVGLVLVSGKCEGICGDGLKKGSEKCDDGNSVPGDGCFGCFVENGFSCDNGEPSVCKTLFPVKFQIVQITKNEENSAQMLIKPKNTYLPFPLLYEQFISSNPSENIFKLELKIPSSPTPRIFNVPLTLVSISQPDYQMILTFQLTFTIESLPSILTIQTKYTKYLPEPDTILFTLSGTNQPLKFTQNIQTFKNCSMGATIQGVVFLVLLFIGLLAPKFIGLEGVLTLQLIFYSQLLIVSDSSRPVGMMVVRYFKFVNGYNSILDLTTYILQTSQAKKYHNLWMSKTIVQNFNTSFMFLFITFAVFMLILLIRRHKQSQLLSAQSSSLDIPQSVPTKQIKELHKDFTLWLKVNEVGFQFLSQVALWCLLPLAAALSAEVLIENSQVIVLAGVSQLWLKARGLVGGISVVIVLSCGLNHFISAMLSPISVGKLGKRMQQQLYKRANFTYLIAMSILICCFHSCSLNPWIPTSLLVLVVHLIYMISLITINPYRQSLRCHTICLQLCQICYLIFLLYINAINYSYLLIGQELNEIITVGMGYVVLGMGTLIGLTTCMRLYYQYRYGEQLEIKIMKERDEEEKRQKMLQEEKLNKKRQQLQIKAINKLSERQHLLMKNPFHYQNEVKQDEMSQLLLWLQQRHIWTQQQKQEYYFNHFQTKPQSWMKKYSKDEYHKVKTDQEAKRKQMVEKERKVRDDPELKLLKAKMRLHQKNLNKKGASNRTSLNDTINQSTYTI